MYSVFTGLVLLCSTRAISTAGVLRMIGKVENAITKQVTQRMTESEPWFEERSNQITALQVKLSEDDLGLYKTPDSPGTIATTSSLGG